MRFEHKSRIQRKQEAFHATGGGTGQDTALRRTLKPAPAYSAARIVTPRIKIKGQPDWSMFLSEWGTLRRQSQGIRAIIGGD